MLRKFVSATTHFQFLPDTCLYRRCPRMPRAKPKSSQPVTSIRSAQMEEDNDLPPLEPEEDETDRLHPSPPTGIPGSDSSDELAPVPDDFTGFPAKEEDMPMQEDQHEKGEEEKPLEEDQPMEEEDIFIKEGEEPLGEFEGFTVTGKKAPRPRSVHADKVVQFEIGKEINTHWMKYITQYPRSELAKDIRKKAEERTGKIKREDVPVLAETFAKNHLTGAINTKALAIAIKIALSRKMRDREYQMLLDNRTFTHWSKMLAAYLRHEKITHSADGSISLEELAVYDPFIRQLCHTYYDHSDAQGLFGRYTADHILIPASFRRYGQLIPFYMPLALVLVYNDKGRFEMAVVRSAEYRVSTLPNLHEYENFPPWRDDSGQAIPWSEYEELQRQFDERVMYSLEDIVMIHLRAVSGQSPGIKTGTPLTKEFIRENPKYTFLVHATVRSAMPSIEKNNLQPMGRRDGDTRPTHFVPFQFLANDPESLRYQTDVIIVYSGYTLCNCKEIYVTSNGYVNLHDKDGVSLSIALLAYDIYNHNYWFSNFKQKYYAPITQYHELMITPRSQVPTEKQHYPDLYQYMRIYCEFKWMVMEDHSRGRYVGRFETYKSKIADALKNKEHIDHWKRVTAHPDPPRPPRRTSQTTSRESNINLLDLAHQVSESADEKQTPVKPKSMPAQPKQTPMPPPKPDRPAPSPPSTPAQPKTQPQPKETPRNTPQREMPKALAKASENSGKSPYQTPMMRGVSFTPGYSTSTVSVPLGRHKKRRTTDRDDSTQPAPRKKETPAQALAGESINIALAVIESQKDTKGKKSKKVKKTAAKSKAGSWRPSLETHAEEAKKKRKKKKGEADEDEEDLTHIAADTEEEEEEIVEVEEEKEQEDEADDEEEVDQPERDDKDDDDDDDTPGAGSAADKKKARPKKRPDTSKSTTKTTNKQPQKEATYRVVEVKEFRYASRQEGDLCDICGDAVGIFHCRKCNMLSCVACCQSEHRCSCGVSHLTSSVSADLLPPMIDTMHRDEGGIISKSLIRDDKFFGSTSTLQQQFRESEREKIVAAQKLCTEVGKRSLEDAIALGDIWKKESTYFYEGIPTSIEHMNKQTSNRGLPIHRPPAMITPIEGLEKDWDLHDRYLNLYRGALNVSGENLKSSITGYTTDSLNLNIGMFNFGNLTRRPHAAGVHKLGQKGTEVLTHLLFNNPMHIAGVCEIGAMTEDLHNTLTKEYNCLCLKVQSICTAPAVGCILKGLAKDGASIQLISHYDQMTRHKDKNYWVLHGATFRCIFGTDCQVTFDKSTGERIQNIPTDVDNNTHASIDHILDAHIYSCPTADQPDKCFIDVPEEELAIERKGTLPYRAGDDRNVRRMHLAEVRVTVFHANSQAWEHAHTETCHHLGKLLYSAIIDQTDFIVGDGNKFAQMNFKSDTHSDYRTCIIIDMLCRILKNINSTRRNEDRITYDVVSSISHHEWLRGSIGLECDPDCCICISLNYGKQQVMKMARCKESTYTDKYPYEGFPNRRETIMIDKERPKYFTVLDIGLRSGDADWHSPLLVTCKLDAIRNHRTRSSTQIKKRTDNRKEQQAKKKHRV